MKIKYFVYILTVALCFQSCDIEEEILDEALGTDLLESASAETLLAPAYGQLRNLYGHRALFALQSYSSDEAILPTRQNDWFDGGTFQELHRHDWTSTHSYIRDTWNHLMAGIGSATQAIDLLEEGTQEKAEAIALLSFNMAWTLDLFGQVPYRGLDNINFNTDSEILVGQDAIDVIVANLEIAMPNLPDGHNTVRFSKDAAKALLARLYLNKGVYTNRYASSHTFDSQDMQKVIDLTTEIINSGRYVLETDNYFSMFDPENENHQEIIFAIKNEVTSPKLGGGNSVTRNTTNGISRGYFLTTNRGIKGSDAGCTLPEFLDTWDMENDPRFFKQNYPLQEGSIPLEQYKINRGFHLGQQYGAKIVDGTFSFDDDGLLEIVALTSTRDDTPANHTREINLIAINQSTGVRVVKWGLDLENENRDDTGVDVVVFRLADIYLMRAEAKLRSSGDALSDVNAVREARGGIDFRLVSADLDDVYNERGFEFYWEYHRRTDQIRFGKWGDVWQDKTDSDVNHRLFPIPPASLAVTSGLVQNTGYNEGF